MASQTVQSCGSYHMIPEHVRNFSKNPDSDGFCGFQKMSKGDSFHSLRLCALASWRSSDLAQSRKDESVTHARAAAIDHRKQQNQQKPTRFWRTRAIRNLQAPDSALEDSKKIGSLVSWVAATNAYKEIAHFIQISQL